MMKIGRLFFVAAALTCLCQGAFAQVVEFDYFGKDDLLVEYRVTKSTSPSSSYIAQGGVVSGFSSGSDSFKTVRVNTKTKMLYIGDNTISYSEDDIRKVFYDDNVLLTGRGYLTKGPGGEAAFQIREFKDNTLYINVTWPSDFGASIIECELKKVKELKPSKK